MEINTVADVIRVHGSERPEDPALLFEGRTVTYGELDERSSRFAKALAAAGVGEQERVTFLDKNSLEYFDALFGTAKANAVLCAVNWRLAPPEAAYVINDTEATLLIVGQDLVPLLEAMEPDLTCTKKILVIGGHERHDDYEEWLQSHEPVDPGVEPGPDDVAFQFYSSGTTGRPKGVMLTNDNCFSVIHANIETLHFRPESVSLVVMPLFHVAGGAWALVGLFSGAPNVLMRDVDPAAIARLMEEHRVTHAVLVPAVIQFMLMLPEVREADYSNLEIVIYGASPISEQVLTDAIRTFKCDFIQGYGMTETTGSVVALMPEDHDPDGPNRHRLRAAGQAGPGVELRVVDPETLEDVPTGDVGEVIVRTRQNMKGYWKLPEETARTLVEGGWLRTGDAGYLDEDGYLYIHDRVKDMIISGGENIYPAEVENVLMSHEGIADVAVIGVPDEKWGETPKAMVVRVPGSEVSEQEVIDFARANVAHYKCPTSVDFVEVLPRNPSGKILKTELRAPFWAGRERRVN